MIYPSQTSLIPATVALARFIEVNGFSGNYPYWYLGSTPTRFLTGPVVPSILVFAHKIFPSESLFTLTISLLLISFLASAIAWGKLVYRISSGKINGFIVTLLLLLFPWRYLSALALDEASFVVARNFLPFSLLGIWGFLQKGSRKSFLIATISTSFLLLVNTSVLPILIVGLVAIVLAKSHRKQKFNNTSKYLKRSLSILFVPIFVVTLWYSPNYWLTILFNPSIGGISTARVIVKIFDLIKGGLPILLAVIAVYFSGKIRTRFTIFLSVWMGTFAFLTIFRFMGDPDFWQDWTSWLHEIEIAIAIIIARNFQFKSRDFLFLSSTFAFLFLPIALSFYVYSLLGRPVLISGSIPKGVKSLGELNEIVNKEGLPAETSGPRRVFLSGSTVFWANALYDIYQVRGGRDQVAIHPTWDKAAYEFRDGVSNEKTKKWLKELDISYVLVHGPNSSEYYHDFKNVEKWDLIAEKIWEKEGDMLYTISY